MTAICKIKIASFLEIFFQDDDAFGVQDLVREKCGTLVGFGSLFRSVWGQVAWLRLEEVLCAGFQDLHRLSHFWSGEGWSSTSKKDVVLFCASPSAEEGLLRLLEGLAVAQVAVRHIWPLLLANFALGAIIMFIFILAILVPQHSVAVWLAALMAVCSLHGVCFI